MKVKHNGRYITGVVVAAPGVVVISAGVVVTSAGAAVVASSGALSPLHRSSSASLMLCRWSHLSLMFCSSSSTWSLTSWASSFHSSIWFCRNGGGLMGRRSASVLHTATARQKMLTTNQTQKNKFPKILKFCQNIISIFGDKFVLTSVSLLVAVEVLVRL